MMFFLSFLWFIRTTRVILFYLYLWQLKEYHLGRFFDHFRTEKGKRLFLNELNLLKLFLLFSFPIVPLLLFFIASILYLFESTKALIDFLINRFKKPVLTKKTIFLFAVSLIIEVLVIFALFDIKSIVYFVFWLVLFDLLWPIVVSLIVVFFQPITVLARNRLIKKAKEKRKKFKNLLVIGITGSYGKTSVKEFLYTILSEKFGKDKVLKTKEHQNSEVGISHCLLNDLKPEHQIFVVEMGAYNKGGIKLLCDIVNPKIGVLTGINQQHLATFGSQENIIKAKYELIESLPDDGLAFFNGKNEYCLKLFEKTKIKKFIYGQEAGFLGQENILGAISVARQLGMSEQEIIASTEKIKNKFGGIDFKKIRLFSEQVVKELSVVDATYSANPDGVIAHLEYLKNLPGRKIIIMPCLIELGKTSKEIHQKIGEKIGQVCQLAIITTKERFKEIKQGAVNAVFLEDHKKIISKLKNFCQSGDIIILESRVPPLLIKELFFPKESEKRFQAISTSLSPNTEKDDVNLAIKMLFSFYRKQEKDFSLTSVLEKEFSGYLNLKHSFTFNSGRSAFLAILNALQISKGDEVLLQAFTCNSAVNPILEKGARPVFVDIDETLNLDPQDLKKKITNQSKVIMVQHTFGCPAQMEEILKIAKENNLLLIEDCAHALGAKYQGKLCGTFGQASFFSFGRDKIISSVFGGLAVTNNDALAEKIKNFQDKLDYPSGFWTFQQLLHPILINYLILPAYGLNRHLGRLFFGFLHRFSILSKAVYLKEKHGFLSNNFPKKFPVALAVLALNQFKKIERFNRHRRGIAAFYGEKLKKIGFISIVVNERKDVDPVFMRYPVLSGKETEKILTAARKKGIFLNDGWRKTTVAPPDTVIEKMFYVLGSCPKAEKIAKDILNLPTHINISQKNAEKIVDFLNNYGD